MSILRSRTSQRKRAVRAARKQAAKRATKATRTVRKGAGSAAAAPRASARAVFGVLAALSAVIFLKRRSSSKTEVPSYPSAPIESHRSTPTPGDTSIAGAANGGAAPLAAVHADDGERTSPHGDPADEE